MKNFPKQTATVVIRSLVISISLLAMMLLGSSFIAITASEQVQADDAGHLTTQCRLVARPSLTDQQSRSMAKDESREGERTLLLTVPAVVYFSHSDDSKPVTPVIELKTAPLTDLKHPVTLTTAASISARKAREFTLVGAKPSGTS